MASSLRWRLQVWHGAILLLAIGGFSCVLYLQLQRSLFQEVDAELLSSARRLESVLQLAPRRVLQGGRPPQGAGRLPERDGDGDRSERPRREQYRGGDRARIESGGREEPGRAAVEGAPPPGAGPPREFPRNPPPPVPGSEEGLGPPAGGPPPGPPQPEVWLELLTLSPTTPPPGPPGDPAAEPRRPPSWGPGRPIYFVVFAGDGGLIKASAGIDPTELRGSPRRGSDYRRRGGVRELTLPGPENSTIIVGTDIRPQMDRLQWLATQLLAISLGVLAVGLLGGWWLAGRAIRPIQEISATARGIEASKLSERFNIAATDTELRELAEILNSMLGRLEVGFEQQARFTADASHELRTPLAVLLSHAELALSRPRSAAEYQGALDTILRSGQRMRALVEDLLTLARMNAGRLELRREPTDLRRLAEETAQLLAPLAAAAEVRIEVGGEPLQAAVDSQRMSQVLLNLIGNAIQYNCRGGLVTVRASTTAEQAVIAVSDTGEGIPPANLPQLFEPFYRVDAARSRGTGGSGLGLAISRRIVQAHGGEIAVRSEVGVGSTFEIRLPLTAA